MSNDPELEGHWVAVSLSSSTIGEKAKWRLRLEVDDCRSSFPLVVVVTWASTRFPPPELRARFAEFERATSGLSFGSRSRLVASLISGDGKSWTFYCVDSPDFLADLNQALSVRPRLPLQIQMTRDPEWSEYEGLKKFVEGRVRDVQPAR